jgi:uncharacterized protein YbjT (DUF2867 family)
MKVILFGGSGMIGQGVLRECLLAADVESVLSVSRQPLGVQHEKLHEVLHDDFTDFSAIAAQLAGFDACFYCLGVSAAGMSEADYTRVTYDFTLAAARTILEASPASTFVFVSGGGTDSSEQGRSMWARVKGKTENALLALPFRRAVMFRPAMIRPRHGARSRTRSYRVLYAVLAPVLPLLQWLAPSLVTTTEIVGWAMLRVAREGAPKKVLECADINALGRLETKN